MNTRERALNTLFIKNYDKTNKELNLSCSPASKGRDNEKLKDDGIEYLFSFLQKNPVEVLRLDWNAISLLMMISAGS